MTRSCTLVVLFYAIWEFVHVLSLVALVLHPALRSYFQVIALEEAAAIIFEVGDKRRMRRYLMIKHA
ncbi:hypothetical protein [Hyphomicrobium sp. 99]|uniref:hypothetical protein n=1 Tax=Hyphomicrobium sp. 99 TaxID=1163419 RepID=UPI0012E089A1|nr:hypothetical protein [Hyphomicrobium sp. 99]